VGDTGIYHYVVADSCFVVDRAALMRTLRGVPELIAMTGRDLAVHLRMAAKETVLLPLRSPAVICHSDHRSADDLFIAGRCREFHRLL